MQWQVLRLRLRVRLVLCTARASPALFESIHCVLYVRVKYEQLRGGRDLWQWDEQAERCAFGVGVGVGCSNVCTHV